MSAHALARQLFAPPGAGAAHTRHLLAQAAGLHARLLDSTVAAGEMQLDRLRMALARYVRSPALAAEKRFVLDDPQFIDALHALASASTDLARWDAAVACGCFSATSQRPLGCGQLGNVVTAVMLRRWRHWCGQIELATDEYGRIHFPFSDWVLVLVDEQSECRDLFAHQMLRLQLDKREARWLLPRQSPQLLVSMPRELFDAMFVDNRAIDRSPGLRLSVGPPRPRFERASRLGDTPIRFESIAGGVAADHAGLTGGIVAALLAAIEQNAPSIHAQLCQCIRTIRGFELPSYAGGHIASFSTPSLPGVIGINVQYTAHDQPRLSPYAFMWLGHELGHTLHYLIDDVAFLHGWQFLENPAEMTPVIPRYGRSVHVRTLFQIPYVHLFEWWLLMLFHDHGFGGLPWRMSGDAFAIGEDLRQEIDEAFHLIDQHARLSATGQAVVQWLRGLVADACSHWRGLSFAAANAGVSGA